MSEIKNIRIAVSGIYDYSLEELPALKLPLPNAGAPEWVVKKDIYKVYRPANVLAVAVDKFKLLPLTHYHPSTLVNGENFKELAIGYTGDSPFVDFIEGKNEIGIRSTVRLLDNEALDAYENGEIQLSPGYTAQFEWKQGTTQGGEPYDILMTKILSVNHLAILPNGRGGKDAAVLDSASSSKTVFQIAKEGVFALAKL